jgi:predicted nucleic acid-binding protein
MADTNVLIDIAVADPLWSRWSRQQLESARRRGSVVINQIIYSEFSIRYETLDEVEYLLPREEFLYEGLPWEAAFAASKAFGRYRRQGGRRERTLPDFYIGAHAVVRGHSILTRDPTGYRAYFPSVDLITPETHP